ncbi:glycosyltransferase [Pullulanibacillus sp. KACC 23026]|uniref:teichuronic acid biosynthesis protein TuaC n=1 Tax=Pullulanibacillus sp. KACC 23026 TaxID=3028315 RepID=UPI0023AF6AE4|nr:glycosyltransferase [Pullulanibacillus sp. KACC 23026]WEG12632.1 glycosyltransferase [Pullulanibacillus sp. KACC 23026]
MKVLWMTSVYPSDRSPSAGVFHETQARAVKKQGVEVSIVCPLPQNTAPLRHLKKAYKNNVEIPETYERNGIKVYRPPYLALPGQLRWAQPDRRIASAALKTIQRYNLEPDLIHAHFAMPSGGAARHVADELFRPWLLTLHGSDVNVYPSYSRLSKRAFIKSVQSADTVLAVGGTLRDRTKDMTDRESLVLPIGIDLGRFHPANETKQDLRKKLGLPSDKKIIVFVGRLTAAKGIHELIETLDFLPDEVAVVMVGEGPLKEKGTQHPEIDKRLFLPGQVENETIRDYIQASDVFVLPSYTEGMPTVIIEALALKCPVICTKVGGVPELFGPYQDLLIDSKSVSGLVKQIKGVLFEDVYTEVIIEALYRKVQTHYNVETNAAELVRIYKKLMPKILNKDNPFLYE